MLPKDHDINELAQQFQSIADGGGFNPFALFAGSTAFHSVFIADFSPSIRRAMAAFAANEPGPLDSLVNGFIDQGHNAARAREQVRRLLQAAVGMCVVTMYNEQAWITIPQLFFGQFSAEYNQQVIQLCGEDFPDPEGLQTALNNLAVSLTPGQHSPLHVASADGITKAIDFWKGFAAHFRELHDHGIGIPNDERQKDLAHWIGTALDQLQASGHELDGDELLDLVYCHSVARHIASALKQLGKLLGDFEPEDEALLICLESLSKIAIAEGKAALISAFATSHDDDISPLLGGFYEWELLRFKLLVAEQASTAEQLAQVEALKKADRKSFRHDLNREPLWHVTGKESGTLLSLQEAATKLDRSLNFVAKRLRSGTIPFIIKGEERHIPERGLAAWQAIMEQHELID